MKKRLITNGILSLLVIVSYILMIVGIWRESLDFTNSPEDYLSNFSTTKSSLLFFIIGMFLFCISSFVSFIMGILTLCMKKHSSVKGLTIASGILAIFGGVCGVNAIVSFIAASKIDDF